LKTLFAKKVTQKYVCTWNVWYSCSFNQKNLNTQRIFCKLQGGGGEREREREREIERERAMPGNEA
jgi:hypothetical protein